MTRNKVKIVVLVLAALLASAWLIGVWRPTSFAPNNDSSDQGKTAIPSVNPVFSWLNYDGSAYSLAYPASWVATTTSYGAIRIQSDAATSNGQGRRTEILILSLGSIFDCSTNRQCFATLQELAIYLGYETTTALSIGGEPSLGSATASGIMKYIVRVDRDGYLITTQLGVSSDTELLSTVLSTLKFH